MTKATMHETIKPVKMIQPPISLFFNFRKHDSGKENPIRKCITAKSASIKPSPKRTTRRKSIKPPSLKCDSITPDKRYVQSLIIQQKIESNDDTTKGVQLLKCEVDINHTNNKCTIMENDDKEVQFKSIIISLDDSDENIEAQSNQTQETERKSGKSPSKCNINTSAIKRIKHDETNQESAPPAQKELFQDIKPEIKAILDDDTVDLNLNDYGVPVDELEMYEPSASGTQLLQTSFDNVDSSFKEITSKNDHDETIICSDAESVEFTAVIDGVCCTFEDTSSTNNTRFSDENKLALVASKEEVNTTADETILQQDIPMKNAMIKAWNDVQNSPYLDLHSDRHSLDILFSLGDKHLEICLRLFARQSKWQRVNKFANAIKLHLSATDLNDTLNELHSLNYIYTDLHERESLATVLNLMQLPELKQMTKSRRIKKRKKPEIVTALCRFANEQPSLGGKTTENVLREELGAKIGRCICLTPDMRESLFRLQLLHHFAVPDINTYFDFYTYVNDVETGNVVLPEYRVREDVLAFENCGSFERYAKAMSLLYMYTKQQEARSKKTRKHNPLMPIAQEAFNNLKHLHIQPADTSLIHRRFTAEHVYVKILTLAITDLTRNVPEVMVWLRYLINQNGMQQRGDWYDKLAMHLEQHERNYQEAANIINRGLAHKDVSHIDKINLTIRADRLVKRKYVLACVFRNQAVIPILKDINKTIIEAKPCTVKHYQGMRKIYQDEEQLYNVEELAIKYYAKHNYPNGIHCEGALLLTFFVALFWDIIYMDIPGAFISRLQYIPLDLFSREFYTQRMAEINRRLSDISCDWEMEKLTDCLRLFNDLHVHKKSIHDSGLGKYLVEAVACIGRDKLALILKRLVMDMRQYRAGLPDLFVWNNNTKKYYFVEVKSHNDKLSRKQEVWIEFLHSIDVRVELFLVNSTGEKVPKARMQ